MNIPGISVIICCYNSEHKLPITLAHLANQKNLQEIAWEIIVIDNGSTDRTTLVAHSEWGSYKHSDKLKVFTENESGLSFARKKGLKESTFEYIIFCDDDNWLDENYLINSFNILNNNKEIGALCGQNFPVSDIEFPAWFYNNSIFYATGCLALNSGDISNNGWVWGAGMVTRKSLINKLIHAGFENYTSDRKGKSLSTGGDVEICKWILLANFKLWYDERLTLKHYIPKERLNKNYLINLKKSNHDLHDLFKIYDFIINDLNKKIIFPNWIKFIVRFPVRFFTKKIGIDEKLMLYKALEKFGLTYNNSTYKNIKFLAKKIQKL